MSGPRLTVSILVRSGPAPGVVQLVVPALDPVDLVDGVLRWGPVADG
ncbi:MAG: hypothetical protein M3Q84_04380 [Actinomycetota bacterium]|nr:hypothetical protein [Nocardioidaceae bacterium]MDQ3113327.1 hypothetical protein [Actinomycetota bacterium]MDQ3450410.1 hypothetical protein [Actinomycetota bacterium]